MWWHSRDLSLPQEYRLWKPSVFAWWLTLSHSVVMLTLCSVQPRYQWLYLPGFCDFFFFLTSVKQSSRLGFFSFISLSIEVTEVCSNLISDSQKMIRWQLNWDNYNIREKTIHHSNDRFREMHYEHFFWTHLVPRRIYLVKWSSKCGFQDWDHEHPKGTW